MKIYCDGKDKPIGEALGVITPEWVDAGNCCPQTTLDLASACRAMRSALSRIAQFAEDDDADMDCDDVAVECVSIAKNILAEL